jgi:hypothetical protein
MASWVFIVKKGVQLQPGMISRVVIAAPSLQLAAAFGQQQNILFPGDLRQYYDWFDTAQPVTQPIVVCTERAMPVDARLPNLQTPHSNRGQNRPSGERDTMRFADLADADMGGSPEGNMFGEDTMSGVTEEVVVRKDAMGNPIMESYRPQ